MMKSNVDHPKTSKSKPRSKRNAKNNLKSQPRSVAENKVGKLPDGLSQTVPQKQLNEDGSNEIVGKKTNPFRKFLNNLWSPIRG